MLTDAHHNIPSSGTVAEQFGPVAGAPVRHSRGLDATHAGNRPATYGRSDRSKYAPTHGPDQPAQS